MAAAARFKSAYDLEDACFKQYSEAMKQPDVVSSDILSVQHERSRQDALDAFDHHPQIKKFKAKLVNAARTSLIQRIEQEHKRVFDINEELRACQFMTTELKREQEQAAEFNDVLDKLTAQNAAHDQKILENNERITTLSAEQEMLEKNNSADVARVEELKAQIDALLQEHDQLDAQSKAILSEARQNDAKLSEMNSKKKKKPFLRTLRQKMGRSYYCYYYNNQPFDENDVYIKSPGKEVTFGDTKDPKLEIITESSSDESTVPKKLVMDSPDHMRYEEREVVTPQRDTLVNTQTLENNSSAMDDNNQEKGNIENAVIEATNISKSFRTENRKYIRESNFNGSKNSLFVEQDTKSIKSETSNEEIEHFKDMSLTSLVKNPPEFDVRKHCLKPEENNSVPITHINNALIDQEILMEPETKKERENEPFVDLLRETGVNDNNVSHDTGSLKLHRRSKQDIAASIIEEKVRVSRASSLSNIFGTLQSVNISPEEPQENIRAPSRGRTRSLIDHEFEFEFIDCNTENKITEINPNDLSTTEILEIVYASPTIVSMDLATNSVKLKETKVCNSGKRNQDQYKKRQNSYEESKFKSWAQMLARTSLVDIDLNETPYKESEHINLSRDVPIISPHVLV